MSEPRRFSLQEEDFRCLVRGGIVNLFLAGGTRIELTLSDIGWDRMYYQIERAIRDHDHDLDSAAAAGKKQDGEQHKDESPAG